MQETLKKVTKQLEFMLLKTIATHIRDESMTDDQARTYAREFLAIEPFQSIEDAKGKMKTLADKYDVFKKLSEFMDAFEHEQKIDKVVNKMQQYINDDNVDEALKVAKES